MADPPPAESGSKPGRRPTHEWLRNVHRLLGEARGHAAADPAVPPAGHTRLRPDERTALCRFVAAQSLDMSAQARAAGLVTLAYLLELAALEAAAAPWPGEPAGTPPP